MSEYQYYEWQTIDRPLTSGQRAAVDKLSSHIDVSSTRAQVDYSWGNFKHDPINVLAEYFDAYLYMANWGSRELAFRFPADLLDPAGIRPYLVDDYVTLEQRKGYYILAFDMAEEDDRYDWLEPGHELSDLAPLRNDILTGDYRMLYLAWLRAAGIRAGYAHMEEEEEDEEKDDKQEEPPIPAGLNKLTAALKTFVDWSELDPHLLQAAARSASQAQPPAETNWDAAIAQLSRAECDAFLRRLVADEAHLSLTLRRHLEQKTGSAEKTPTAPRRTMAELQEVQKSLQAAEAQRQAETKRRQQEQRMADLAQREEAIWQGVERLLATSYKPKDYDTVAAELAQLRQLAESRQSLPAFQGRLDSLIEPYTRRSSLMDRLKNKKVLS